MTKIENKEKTTETTVKTGINEFTLPISGKVVTMRRGKGYDIKAAQKLAVDQADVTYALLAILCEFDGDKITYEEILDFDLKDVLELQTQLGD